MELKVSIKVDAETRKKIAEAFPAARVTAEKCELKVEAVGPSEAAGRTREILEKLRGIVSAAKDFK